MSIRTILVIILSVVLTIFFLENNQIVEINLWVFNARVSKSILLPSLTILGFLIGYITGHVHSYNRRRRKEKNDLDRINKNAVPNSTEVKGRTLSEEDQKYLE